MTNIRGEFRYSWRLLAAQPAVSICVIASLAVGVAANTAVFSMVRGILLSALPYPSSDRVFDVRKVLSTGAEQMLLGPEVVAWRHASTMCAQVAAYTTSTVNVQALGRVDRMQGAEVSPGFFEALGVVPITGRTFRADEEAPGSRVVVVSTGFARARHQEPQSLVGAMVAIDDVPHEVVGVVPTEQPFPLAGTTVWTPLSLSPIGMRIKQVQRVFSASPGRLPVICRLADGATRDHASTELSTTLRHVGTPESEAAAYRVTFTTLLDRIIGPVRPMLWLLQGAAALLLLLICVNVTSLLLARGLDRERETQIRASLGASPMILARQALIEGLVPSMLGGLLGGALAYGLLELLVLVAPPELPRLNQIRVDGTLIMMALTAGLIAGILASAIPAARLWWRGRSSFAHGAHAGPLSVHTGSTRRLQVSLVVVEVTLAVVLVSTSLNLGAVYRHLLSAPIGLSPGRVVSARLAFPDQRHPMTQDRVRFLERLSAELSGLSPDAPAVMVVDVPFGSTRKNVSFALSARLNESERIARSRIVSTGYFELLGIPIRQGRSFSNTDRYPAPPVAVVNQAFVEAHGLETPVGESVGVDGVTWRIVGVVGNTRQERVLGDDEPAIYRMVDQLLHHHPMTPGFGSLPQVFVLAAADDSRAQYDRFASVVAKHDPHLMLDDFQTLEDRIQKSFARTTFVTLLMLVLAVLSVLLAGVGIFGILTHWVSRRTREIGVRAALGATPARLVQMVAREGSLAIAAGLVLGGTAAWQAQRLLANVVPGSESTFWTAMFQTILVILVIATAACMSPAARAARVEPSTALRAD